MRHWWGVFLFLAAMALRGQEVALTFDDLPYTGVTPDNTTRAGIIQDLAKILQDANVPPVYGFINGGKTDMEAVQAWTAAGFLLGSHGFSHLNLTQTPLRRYTRDIIANEPVLRSLVANEDQWHWFRYPYLAEGETLRKKHAVRAFLKAHHYRVAEVSLDFEDFLWNAPYARCLAQNDAVALDWLRSNYLIAAEDRIEYGQKMSQILYGRDIKYILLLHVGGFETVMLPELLKLLEKKHFKLITLPEAARDPAYAVDPEWPTRHGGDFLTLTMHHRDLELPWHRRFPRAELRSICR